MKQHEQTFDIKAIIGLGNPGRQYYYHRHNIGFRVLDALAERHHGIWHSSDLMESTEISINGKKIILIKPQTFMNNSGKVIPFLIRKGMKPEHMLVIHDELEQPFGKLSFKMGGSARGHNGLRSIIGVCGAEFPRLRVGVSRPQERHDVPNYVLSNFTESEAELQQVIDHAVAMIEQIL
jgi:peptidyl-tRNA hydrolase, PTH1 family